MGIKKPETYWLEESGGALDLVLDSPTGELRVKVDFPSYLESESGCRELASQPLIRATGRRPRFVVDATAGMGQDSIAMAVFGHRVIGFERSEVVFSLLKAGLQSFHSDPKQKEIIGDRLAFIYGDASSEMANLETAPEVVYIDPMYPSRRKKSALAKKEMQVLRALVGDDQDSGQLFEAARKIASDRVVVKRPVYAEPIVAGPSMSYESKLVRFDVYLNNTVKPEKP